MKLNPRRPLVCLLAAALLAFVNTTLRAATITFEGDSGFAQGIGSFIDAEGFRFTISGGGGSFEIVTGQGNIVEPNTTKLFAANHVEITMTKVGGGAFSLSGVDIGGSWTDPTLSNRWADHVDVTDGTTTVTATLAGHDATYVNLATPFNDVTSVSFIPTVNADLGSNDYEFTIDNLQVQTVPEAGSTAALLGIALAGMLRLRRKN